MAEITDVGDTQLPILAAPADTEPVACVDPIRDDTWNDLVMATPSDVFHAPAWLRAVSSTYGFEIAAHVVMRDSEPVAGIPCAVVEGLDGTKIATFPFSDYCDPLASSAEDWRLIGTDLISKGLPLTIRCLHNDLPLDDERFTVFRKAKWHDIDLMPDGNDIWSMLKSQARQNIRKAQRAQVEVVQATAVEDLRSFYELHLRIRKNKYRLLAQPFAFFESIWREFIEPGNGTLLLTRVGREIVGGALLLSWKNKLYYKFNASDPAFLDFRPNDATMWASIEYGQSEGLQCLDLGLSDWDQEGLVRYKRKYASQEKTISFLSYYPDGTSPSPTRLAKVVPQLTELLTDPRVPNDVTEQAGAALYRYFV